MKKTLIIFSVLVLQAVSVRAYDYPYLILSNVDGSIKSIGVESLTMTFENGLLMMQNEETNASFSLTELNKMFFASENTGIDMLLSSVVEDGGVEVFSLSGIKIGRYKSEKQVFMILERGIYVIKHNGQTQKIVIR